jgi:hypothetical protein
MILPLDASRAPPHPSLALLDELISEHGARRTILALLSALARRRARLPRADAHLGPHMARDIGLWADPPSKRHWDLR